MHVRNKKKIVAIMGIVVIIICIVLVPVHKMLRKKWEKDRKEYLLKQQQLKQELEPFMEEAKKVMRGQKTETGEMALYNFSPDGYYENVSYIDADADIIVADIQGDKGTLVITYYIHRLDKTGECISSEDCDIMVWEIAKNETWELVNVPDPLGGDRERAEKLMKKMMEYGVVEYNENWILEYHEERMTEFKD